MKCFCTYDAFHIRIRKDVSEQVCVSVCVCAYTLLTQGMVDCTFSFNNAGGWGGRMGLLLGYHQGRLVTYLQPVHFFDIAPRLSSNLASRFPIS